MPIGQVPPAGISWDFRNTLFAKFAWKTVKKYHKELEAGVLLTVHENNSRVRILSLS
jgi:hypothetical protein